MMKLLAPVQICLEIQETIKLSELRNKNEGIETVKLTVN